MRYTALEAGGQGDAANRRIRLFQTGSECHVGVGVFDTFRRARLTPSTTAWDFAALAFSALTADHDCLRSQSPDGWTRQLDLTVAVSDPDLWNSQSHLVVEALQFLTTDRWSVEFVPREAPYPNPETLPDTSETVCLLSGGLDSLIGSLEVGATKAPVIFVSQVAKGDAERQRRFASVSNPKAAHLQVAPSPHSIGHEASQRSRSLAFFAIGALAATSTTAHVDGGDVSLLLPENGFIAINPALAPSRIGSLSTRTAHPTTIGKVQAVFDATGLRVNLTNPYALLTKGEMLANVASQRDDMASLASDSTSCGRFLRFGYVHCGRCVPCQIRRASFLAANLPDTTTYKHDRLGLKDPDHALHPDVRDVTAAIVRRETQPISRWAGTSVASPFIDDTTSILDMLDRGIAELRALHETLGVL